jgi:cytochrome P450
MIDLTDKQGNIVQLNVAGKDILLVSDPDAIQSVLIDNNDQYQKGGFQKRASASLLGNGLVLAEGDEWRDHRHALAPAFHPRHMSRFAECIRKQTATQLSTWSDKDVLDFDTEMQELTLAVITDALFDIDIREERWELGETFAEILDHFAQIGQTFVYVPEWIPTRSNRRYKRALADLNDVIDEIIESHIQGNHSESSVVSRLLGHAENSDEWDKKSIRDELVTLLVAGHETTALALTFTTYLLGTHSEQLVETQEAVDRTAPSSFGHDTRCDSLDNVIDESLRLYPPAYNIYREPLTDVSLAGYHVPEGTIIALSQWVTHRNSSFYDSPTEFRPGRWTDEFRSAVPPGAYFPFAAGPRRCIGEQFSKLEMHIVLTMILQQYDLDIVSETPLDVVPSLSTRPANPVRVRVTKR